MATSEGLRRLGLAGVAALLAIGVACGAREPRTVAPGPREPRPGALSASSASTASDPPPQDAAASDADDRPLFYLGEVEVESQFDGGVYGPGQPLRVTLEIAPPRRSAFHELASRVTQKPASDSSFTFDLRGYPRPHDPVTPAYGKSTFVIDYDEPPVKEVHAKAAAAYGPKPKTSDLERFVDEYIDRKDMQRPFDLASQVAERKEGDCTEHAVLLTALARSFGYPARVVLGLVLIQQEGKVFAYGHAWVECWDGKRWGPLDATPTRNVADVRYLPTQVLSDEGPGFKAHLMETMGAAMLVKRASVAPL